MTEHKLVFGLPPPDSKGHRMIYFSAAMREMLGKGILPQQETVKAILTLTEAYKDTFRGIGAHTIATTLHVMIDEQVEQLDSPVSCTKGCNGCCHMHVDVHPQEAELLADYAKHINYEIDVGRLTRQSFVTPDTWETLPWEDRKCVFNGADGTCQVYAHRPSSCRKYFVKNDPALCGLGSEAVIDCVALPGAELVDSAAINAFGGGSMAPLLLKVLNKG